MSGTLWFHQKMGVVQRWKLMQEAEHLKHLWTKGNKL